MSTILIIGAGKSSSFLISHLLETATSKNRSIIIADLSLEVALQKAANHPAATAKSIDLENVAQRRMLIESADVVISMLPASLHPIIAQDCLDLNRHFFSASYESDFMRNKSAEILSKGLLFLNECGLDPGLDHMSAMRIIHAQQKSGHTITSFKSYCGGVLAPESEDNPWKYKFTWNPKNVILAGQGVSKYICNGEYKYLPYHKLFSRLDKVEFEEVGIFEGYPNRDSLNYRKQYNLENIPTLLRGTLRRPGYCQSWNVFVQLGLTDDSFTLDLPQGFTFRQLLEAFLPPGKDVSLKHKLLSYLPELKDADLERLYWLGILEDKPLPKLKGSPAYILQAVLEEKWILNEGDRDMIVMQHCFTINSPEDEKQLISSLVIKGESAEQTAMAKTVGLPLAIAVDLFLDGKITSKGAQIPVIPEIYNPILDALSSMGVEFKETYL
jgi:saccharopine dehydrogenase-like NADP-dependent oxidoreductase